MNLHDLPPDDFMPAQPLDEDSSFTYRKRQRVFPRDALASEIEAGILRLAHAKYRARGLNDEGEEGQDSAGDAVDTEMRDSLEDDEDFKSETNAGTTDSDSEHEKKPKRRSRIKTEMRASERGDPSSGSEDGEHRQRTPELRGVPAADDDVSSAILQPAVSDIVAKLEKTLTVLHNMMVSTVQTVDDEDDSEDETGVDEPFPTHSRSRLSRSRSRPRRRAKRPRSDSEFPATDPESEAPLFASPQKRVRYAGAEEDEDEGIEEAEAKDAEEEDEEDEEGEGQDPSPPPAEPQPPMESSTAPEEQHPPDRILRRRAVGLNRLAPRNWRAVLGAASLAGFSREAILRATQRCADLFGEGAGVHLLNDHSPARDTRNTIVPGGGVPTAEGEDGLGELGEVTRIRLAARDASRVEESEGKLKSGSPSPTARTTRNRTTSQTRSRTPAPRRSHTPSGSRSRSRSRSATPHLACPYRSCPRSVDPFSRRGNLVRHIEVVHGGEGLGMDVDSEDEVEGGVHVDGFLRQVRARRGWRGEDVGVEERGRGVERERRGRGRRAKVEDGGFGAEGVFGGHDVGMDDGLY